MLNEGEKRDDRIINSAYRKRESGKPIPPKLASARREAIDRKKFRGKVMMMKDKRQQAEKTKIQEQIFKKLMAETVGHYAVLGLGPNATEQEIKAAYRRAVLATHPDRNPGSAPHEAAFKDINTAHEVLSDPKLRSNYDKEIDSIPHHRGWRTREIPTAPWTTLPKVEPARVEPARVEPAKQKKEPFDPNAWIRAGWEAARARDEERKKQQGQQGEAPSGNVPPPTQSPPPPAAAPEPAPKPVGGVIDEPDWNAPQSRSRPSRGKPMTGYRSPRNVKAQRDIEAGFIPNPADIVPRSRSGSARDVGSSGFGQVQNPTGSLTPEQQRQVGRGFTERPIDENYKVYKNILSKLIEEEDPKSKAARVADNIESTMRANGATEDEISRMRASGATERLATGTGQQKPSGIKRPGENKYKRKP
jgi:curved DNA-binding protein CbpA